MNINSTYYQSDNNKLQSILNSFADAIIVETNSRVVEFVNEGFCTLFKIKYPLEAVIGTNCQDIFVATSLQFKNPSRFIYRIDEIIAESVPIKGEELFLQDGRTLLRDYAPIIVNNQIVGHSWLYRVAPKAIEAEPPLQQNSFRFLQNILDHIPTPIAVLNTQHEYLFINKWALPDESKRKIAIGKTEIEFNTYYNKPNEVAIKNAELIRTAIQEKKTIFFEETSTTDAREELYNKVVLIPLITDVGDVEGILKYAIDITLLREKENQLQQIIEQYTDVLNSVNDIVIMTNDKLEIDFSNKSFQNKLSLNAEFTKSIIFNHVELKQYDFYKNIFSVLAGNEEQSIGRISLDKSTNRQTFSYQIKKLTSSNKYKQNGIVAILNDISNEVHLEENLLEVVKREKELNELKSAFVNMVSHEMRTPLAIISSCAEIIQLMIASGKPKEEIESYAGHILSEVERMTTFMNDILMVSKIEAGKIDFHPETVSLIQFINDLNSKSYSPSKDGRHLDVFVKGNEQVFPVDTKMIRHILQNLLDNAFKYSIGKPSPRLRLSYSKSCMTFTILDYGIGVHQDDIPTLFSSFARGRNVGSINGTGIGLVVVKYFVDQHKGTIAIKSRLNLGTIFSVKIPY